MATVQGHYDPWHPRLLDKVEAQLDAILEAYSQDYPHKLKFERKGTIRERERVESLSLQWASKLIGNAKDYLRNKVSFKIPDSVRRPRHMR